MNVEADFRYVSLKEFKCFKNHFGILPTEVRESIVLPKSKSDTRIEKVKEE